MPTLLDYLATHLVTAGFVRRPDVAGPAGRPWLPPVWRHPDTGAIGPGDAEEQKKPATSWDDGLVVSLMWAPGVQPETGAEERRIDGVDVRLRGRAVPAIVTLDAAIRAIVVGKTDPGGRSDFVLGGGLYVIQARQWSPFQPLGSTAGVYTFTTGYIFETRVP